MNQEQMAVYEDAKTIANVAMWGVELQIKRLSSFTSEIADFVMQPVIDFHFLVTTLSRLRSAAVLASKVGNLKEGIERFDAELSDLKSMRNILEHIDEYRVGAGRNKKISSQHPFQTIIFDSDSIKWLDYELRFSVAMKAGGELLDEIYALLPDVRA